MTRSRSSGSEAPARRQQRAGEPNALMVVGRILDRFRLASGFNIADNDKDHDDRVLSFLEVLGAARIPPRHYETLYRRAMASRATKMAAGQQVSYMLAAVELAAEWPALAKELAEGKGVPAGTCPQPHDNEEERLVAYCESPSAPDVLLPCHVCRRQAHDQRRAEIRDKKRSARPRLAAVPVLQDQTEEKGNA